VRMSVFVSAKCVKMEMEAFFGSKAIDADFYFLEVALRPCAACDWSRCPPLNATLTQTPYIPHTRNTAS